MPIARITAPLRGLFTSCVAVMNGTPSLCSCSTAARRFCRYAFVPVGAAQVVAEIMRALRVRTYVADRPVVLFQADRPRIALRLRVYLLPRLAELARVVRRICRPPRQESVHFFIA